MTDTPTPDPSTTPQDATARPDVTIVACATDAAPYLLEWVAWHVLLGVSRFVVYSYACRDGTEAMLDRLADIGPLEHHRLERVSEGKQILRSAVNAASDLPALQTAEWAIALNVDEFIEINVGHGTLTDLVEACEAQTFAAGSPHVDAIALPWRIMGSHGHTDFDPAPVSERFTRGTRIDGTEPDKITGYRSLFRPSSFDSPGPSRPWFEGTRRTRAKRGRKKKAPPPQWVNGSGEDINELMSAQDRKLQNTLPDGAFGADKACIRRYAVKSRMEFLYVQLGEVALGDGPNAPSGWDAWTLRNLNSVRVDPLCPSRLRDAIGNLDRDPVLKRLQDEAREAVSRDVARLVAAQPVARHFLETGQTWTLPETPEEADDEASVEPRFLCIACHPRTVTFWFRRMLQEASRVLDIPLIRVTKTTDLDDLPPTGPAFLINRRSRFPRALFTRTDARIMHVVRDPRDMLISAAQYYASAPIDDERTIHAPRPEFSGLSYQGMLKALPDDATRLRFEMDHRHSDVIEDMTAWAYDSTNTLELRYEDLIRDQSCTHFAQALAWTDIPSLDHNTMLSCYWKHALFGGIAEQRRADSRVQRHITSAQPERWRAELPREVAADYAKRYGGALRLLGYAEDDGWVEECQT